MSKEGIIAKLMEEAVQKSGWSEEKIEEITSYMVTYLNTGAKYGETPQGFLRWYVEDMGGQL